MTYASACDGIGAVHVAWQPFGWRCAWTAEIEPFPAAVVEHHYGFPNLGDITEITDNELEAHGPIDLLVGGTPCQSFSVAGLRAGMADPRGNLALAFLGLAARARPEWLVWENVPGVLSSNEGRDFGTFLGALGQLGYGFAYRVLDAQYFGLAQRRKRVFVVGNLGDWRRAAAVLFERESLSGNPAPGKEAGSRVAALTANGVGTCGADDNQAQGGHLVDGHLRRMRGAGTVGAPLSRDGRMRGERRAHDGGMRMSRVPRGRADGLRADEAGIGAVVASFKPSHYTRGKDGAPSETFPPLSADADKGDQDPVVLAFDARQPDVVEHGNQSGPLDTDGHSVAVAFDETQITSGENRCNPQPGDPSRPIPAHGRPPTLATPSVRRLTPRECERLQGFPDNFTATTYRNKPAADGSRYKVLGNSMAVPVMRWIGERIEVIA